MHFIARSQVRSDVHSWLHSIAHSQPAWIILSSKLQDTPNYTPTTLPSTPPSTFSSTHPGMLSRTLPIALDGTLPACLTVQSQVSKLSRRSQAYSPARSQIHFQLHSMTLPACLTIRSQGSSQDTLKLTHKHALKYTPNCTWWHTPSLLDCTLPSKLSRHPQVHLRVALKYTSEHALKYAPNCTRWYTPSLLGSTLPSTLSRGKTLPISLDYMLPCISCMLNPETVWVANARQRQAWGWWRMTGSVWRAAGGRWQAAYDGRNHDVGRYSSLNLIFSAATMTRSHDASRSWCWQLQP